MKHHTERYREVEQLVSWCNGNNLSLNVDKTKEVVIDFRRTPVDHSPLFISGSTVESVRSSGEHRQRPHLVSLQARRHSNA